jgi:hypothetical protein
MANIRKYVKGSKWPGRYGDMEVLEYIDKRRVLVKFIETGFEKYTDANSVGRGTAKDPYYKSVCGVGCIGESCTSKNGKVKQSYFIWRGMLRRCYDLNDRSDTYYGKITVCDEWLVFAVFEKWFEDHYIDGFDLDKDLTVFGSKTYSPTTCSFIPTRINCLIGKKERSKACKYPDLPTGVSYHKKMELYTAQCYDGKLISLGSYATAVEAEKVYKSYKKNLITSVAKEYYRRGEINTAVYKTLLNYEP